MMAPDGRCKFGDARANGYVRQRGRRNRRAHSGSSRPWPTATRIYSVIIGSAVNNERQQQRLPRDARRATARISCCARRIATRAFSPGRVQYVEAHGTGTHAGDPVELGALGSVLAEDRIPGRPCRIGIGENQHRPHRRRIRLWPADQDGALPSTNAKFPPTFTSRIPNPRPSPWDELPIVVSSETARWPIR